jgi:heterodisulfide reductase subunit A-like polyferredoxin
MWWLPGLLVLTLIQLLCVTAHGRVPTWKALQDRTDVQQEYDYVVIGGGTAGLTVSDRLIEDGKTTVLVIEHGELGKHLHPLGIVPFMQCY